MFENEDLILDGIKQGEYNLYLGAGATYQCNNRQNKNLPMGEELLKIIQSRFSKTASSLYQITKLVSQEDLNNLFQEQFIVSKLSTAIERIPKFIWKRIFTLNIDNAIETAYKQSKNKKQELISSNFKDDFCLENDISKLQIIHLHGVITKPEDGYVFNANQYIQNIKDNNTWMTVFSDLFRTGSFIMSGLSFNEQDVDFYLSYRSNISQKPGALPSILIEPYPTDYTKSVCKEHGFQLVESTFDDFIAYIYSRIKYIPTIYDLKTPKQTIFKNIDEKSQFCFFNEFELIKLNDNITSQKTPFDYGFEPSISDIQSDKDVHRNITDEILNKIISIEKGKYGNLILLTGKYLNGKTTIALRILNYFSKQDYYCFKLKSMRGFNNDNTIKCIEKLDKSCMFYIDNVAEYIHQVSELIARNKSVIIIGTERSYRITHIRKVLKDQFFEYNCDSMSDNETDLLLKKYLDLGLVLNSKVLQDSNTLLRYTVGEQVCIIVDSYDPIKNKIEDLLKIGTYLSQDITALLAVAICCFCYKPGLNYYVIMSMLPNNYNFNKLFKIDSPLKLAFNLDDKDYVIPMNKLYTIQLLEYFMSKEKLLLQNIYIKIVQNIARSVNRKTIIKRTPESKLMARMLDADKNVKYFFGNDSEKFMVEIQNVCEWNSRYWEQRALGVVDKDIDTAIEYAKHAVSIEYHPYPLTTLGKILFRKMENTAENEKTNYCIQALNNCLSAMKEESKRHIESIHPLITLIAGMQSYMKNFDGKLLPYDLKKRIYAGIDMYEQEIDLSINERKQLEKIKDYVI